MLLVGRQKITGGWLSPFTVWMLGLELGSSALSASVLTFDAILVAQNWPSVDGVKEVLPPPPSSLWRKPVVAFAFYSVAFFFLPLFLLFLSLLKEDSCSPAWLQDPEWRTLSHSEDPEGEKVLELAPAHPSLRCPGGSSAGNREVLAHASW